jgi:hypothetical protein
MHDALRQACLTIRPTPPSKSNVGGKSDRAPFLLRRWFPISESWEYAYEAPDGSVWTVGHKANARPFWTKHEARMWRAERPKFWSYEIALSEDGEKRSLPPEDEDEPDSEGREREQVAERSGLVDIGDIGRGPEMLGANLPRFAGRES